MSAKGTRRELYIIFLAKTLLSLLLVLPSFFTGSIIAWGLFMVSIIFSPF